LFPQENPQTVLGLQVYTTMPGIFTTFKKNYKLNACYLFIYFYYGAGESNPRSHMC
jgi:hypothetical protein